MPIAARYAIEKLILSRGACPFDEWFESLSREDQFMVDNRLARVRLGSFGEINHVGEGVWELKFRKGSAVRIYYARTGYRIILLIAGGEKRTQKKDIQQAIEHFRQFKKGVAPDEDQ
jgi:putative addiction module killer protein